MKKAAKRFSDPLTSIVENSPRKNEISRDDKPTSVVSASWKDKVYVRNLLLGITAIFGTGKDIKTDY